jgi:hypothetical protein
VFGGAALMAAAAAPEDKLILMIICRQRSAGRIAGQAFQLSAGRVRHRTKRIEAGGYFDHWGKTEEFGSEKPETGATKLHMRRMRKTQRAAGEAKKVSVSVD